MWKALEIAKFSKKISKKGSGTLEVKQCFQRESFIKYLRVTLVFIAKLSAFQGFTAGVNNAFFLARRLSTRLLFDEV